MIPPHKTPEDLVAYLRKLADVFEEIAKQHGAFADKNDWPWGDIVPLRAAADWIEQHNRP